MQSERNEAFAAPSLQCECKLANTRIARSTRPGFPYSGKAL